MNATTDTPKVTAPEGQGNTATAVKAKKVREAKTCRCEVPGEKGCNGAQTKGIFAPGHDAKLVGHLTRQVVAGHTTKALAVEALSNKGGSQLLQSKLGAAIDREVAKRDNAAKRESERLAAKATKDQEIAFAKEQAEAVKADRKAKEQAEG